MGQQMGQQSGQQRDQQRGQHGRYNCPSELQLRLQLRRLFVGDAAAVNLSPRSRPALDDMSLGCGGRFKGSEGDDGVEEAVQLLMAGQADTSP